MKRAFFVLVAVVGMTTVGMTTTVSANKPSEVGLKSDVLKSVVERFAAEGVADVPDFQRHVMPLFGRMGCNGRACHGSFQGRGGFRLSLFGYDFKKDHEALFDKDSPRVDLKNVDESLIISKPTDADNHEGGLRYKKGTWEYNLIHRWIETGAKSPETPTVLKRMEIVPAEVWFQKSGAKVQLKAIAVWADGLREDVTPLCRFKSNDDQVCTVDENGLAVATKTGDTHIVISYDKDVVPVPVIRPVSDKVGKKYPNVPTPTMTDELVVQKLRKMGVVPSELCDDATFLRRIRLDMTGTLPMPDEVEKFLADSNPKKRANKIDELLETPAYAAWWTTKLCDFTGNNDSQLNNAAPVRGQASREWYEWILKRVSENKPYDELVEGIAVATSIKKDQTYLDFCKKMSDVYRPDSGKSFADLDSMTYYWARQDFREIEARAIGFAYSFMGIRIQCAQCHKHPFDQWSKNDFHQFKNFFARVVSGRNGAPREFRDEYNKLVDELGLKGKRGNELRKMLPELLKAGKTIPFPATYNSPTIQRTRNPMGEYPVFDNAKLLGGAEVDVKKVDEPRQALMDWLRGPENRFFAPAFVNRVWASYFGRGIVEPADDLSLANPPSNKPLLDYLAKGFIESKFDMKWVHRTIANSRTYQLSWKANETNALDEKNFSRAVHRRLPAEVAYDAIQMAAADSSKLAEMHEDIKGRAIAIPGAGYRNQRGNTSQYALSVFGRSTRDTNCDCDRSSEPTLLQTVYLQNDRDTLQLVSIRRGGWLDEVAKQVNPSRTANRTAKGKNSAPQRIAQLRRQYAQMQKQLKKLKNKDGNEKQIARLQQRLDLMKKQVAKSAPNNKPEQAEKPEKVEVAAATIDGLIKQAYLRTLSRFPNDTELARSQQYIKDADDTVDGIRDLLWALLNTKEFIVNH